MKRTPKSPAKASLLAFGAHPDDIEFGCGGIVASEMSAGRAVHFVICSRGESGSKGDARQRAGEARRSAALLGATVEFLELGGDAHFEVSASCSIRLARVLRRVRPGIVLAPSVVGNQHPDHARLGAMVRDASRLARYGGVKELRALASHRIGALFYYAITPEAEPKDVVPVLVDISAPKILATWISAMQAHRSQVSALPYVELQLARARLRGLQCGVGHAMALFPNDPVVIDSLDQVIRS